MSSRSEESNLHLSSSSHMATVSGLLFMLGTEEISSASKLNTKQSKVTCYFPAGLMTYKLNSTKGKNWHKGKLIKGSYNNICVVVVVTCLNIWCLSFPFSKQEPLTKDSHASMTRVKTHLNSHYDSIGSAAARADWQKASVSGSKAN